jgi:hypothetical protein
MVQDGNAGGPVKNIPALEMLTEAAAHSTDARNALLDLAKANAIGPRAWAYIAPMLAGDQIQFQDSGQPAASPSGNPAKSVNGSDIRSYHIAAGNQNFYTTPPAGGMTQDQIAQQTGLIDGLISLTSDPVALQTLQNAKAQLQKRAPAPAPPH